MRSIMQVETFNPDNQKIKMWQKTTFQQFFSFPWHILFYPFVHAELGQQDPLKGSRHVFASNIWSTKRQEFAKKIFNKGESYRQIIVSSIKRNPINRRILYDKKWKFRCSTCQPFFLFHHQARPPRAPIVILQDHQLLDCKAVKKEKKCSHLIDLETLGSAERDNGA